MRFQDKVAIVTGGSSGIGEAVARQLAREGAHVIIWSRDIERGEAAAGTINAQAPAGKACFAQVDVTDWHDVERASAEAMARHGRLDTLINNVGQGFFGETPDLAVEDWHRAIALSLDATFYCCKAVIPAIRDSGGGTVVNVASISGLRAEYGIGAYNAAKGGLINYTRSLALDHIRQGVRINAICPGLVETPQVQAIKDAAPHVLDHMLTAYPRGTILQPDEIASVVLYLAGPESTAIVGSAVVADGGLMAWSGAPRVTPDMFGQPQEGADE